MSNNMLGDALREYTGLRYQLDVNLLGENGSEWAEQLKRFNRKEPCWVNGQATQVPATTPALELLLDPIDPIIHVDRSVRPSYPYWVKMVMHSELENAGPSQYDVSKDEQWLHDDQKDKKLMRGNKIYAHLKESGDLKNHYTLRDLEEIQKRGITFFRKYFAGEAVFAWGSVVWNLNGALYVPCLYECSGEVAQHWYYLDNVWDGYHPALRHAS